MGWKKDPFDQRDFSFAHVKHQFFAIPLALPTKQSWRSQMGKQEDQGEVGACVAFGIIAYLEWLAWKAYGAMSDLAERFIYSRRPNKPQEGMYIRDGLDIVKKSGACTNALCPGVWYSPGINADTVCDSPEIQANAATYKIASYARLQNVDEIKQALQNGPVVVGVLCTDAWIYGSATLTGHIPDPGPNPNWIGGHCICITGYDDATGEFEFKNSWYLVPGVKPWGDGGYGYFHYSYIGDQLTTQDADAWVMVFQGSGPTPPPVPPDPVADLKKCLQSAGWNLAAIVSCIVTFLKAEGWLATATTKADGSVNLHIKKK